MRMVALAFALLMLMPSTAWAATDYCRLGTPDYAFTTDGCSMFPDGPWKACCVTHDQRYWCGGSREERRLADAELERCVASTGHPETAETMRAGVRVFGHPLLPLPWRWGYGWRWPKGYTR